MPCRCAATLILLDYADADAADIAAFMPPPLFSFLISFDALPCRDADAPCAPPDAAMLRHCLFDSFRYAIAMPLR